MEKTYITEQGDTWDKIAYKVYGDEKFMRQLILANWSQIETLVFSSGTELILPEISETDTEGLPPWRSSDDYDAGIEAEDGGDE